MDRRGRWDRVWRLSRWDRCHLGCCRQRLLVLSMYQTMAITVFTKLSRLFFWLHSVSLSLSKGRHFILHAKFDPVNQCGSIYIKKGGEGGLKIKLAPAALAAGKRSSSRQIGFVQSSCMYKEVKISHKENRIPPNNRLLCALLLFTDILVPEQRPLPGHFLINDRLGVP